MRQNTPPPEPDNVGLARIRLSDTRWIKGKQMNLDYKTIRSKRKTYALQITPEGLLIRAPLRAADEDIYAFVQKHRRWIETHLQKQAERKRQLDGVTPLRPEELRELAERAKTVIPLRVQYYAAQLGVTYGRITIRCQRTRWGSCSASGNLNFNVLLMLAPPEVLDSVVVHELCHRLEMNHSPRFYAEVLRVFPEYRKWHGWLKENGKVLMKMAE